MIDEFLATHGITQYRLARLLGRTDTTIARWRKNGPPYPLEMELALAELARRLKI